MLTSAVFAVILGLAASTNLNFISVRVIGASQLQTLLSWDQALKDLGEARSFSEERAVKMAQLASYFFQSSVLPKIFTDPTNVENRRYYERVESVTDLKEENKLATTRKTLNGKGFTGCSACPWLIERVCAVAQGKRCADIGCGLNSQLMMAMLLSRAANVTLLDESASHLAAMLLRVPSKYINHVDALCCLLPEVPNTLEDASIDIMTIINVLHFLSADEIKLSMARLMRKLATGGFLAMQVIISGPGQTLPTGDAIDRPWGLTQGNEHAYGAHMILPATIYSLLADNGLVCEAEGMLTGEGMLPFNRERFLRDMSITVWCIIARRQ